MRIKKGPTYYEDPDFRYQDYWQTRRYEDNAERICLRRLFSEIRNKESLIDIGGGYGRLVNEYTSIFRNCVLLDPSERLLKEAKKFSSRYKNLIYKKGVAENIPFENGSFDLVLLIRAFHHLTNPLIAISEIYRILKPKGFLILEFANKTHFKNFLKAIFRLDFGFFTYHLPENIGKKEEGIPFLNYHPNQVKTLLLSNGFVLKKTFSVSNFRLPIFKKNIPLKILLGVDSVFSYLTSKISFLASFGPSIFILAQKKEK